MCCKKNTIYSNLASLENKHENCINNFRKLYLFGTVNFFHDASCSLTAALCISATVKHCLYRLLKLHLLCGFSSPLRTTQLHIRNGYSNHNESMWIIVKSCGTATSMTKYRLFQFLQGDSGKQATCFQFNKELSLFSKLRMRQSRQWGDELIRWPRSI
jgi:hypothetical protein